MTFKFDNDCQLFIILKKSLCAYLSEMPLRA